MGQPVPASRQAKVRVISTKHPKKSCAVFNTINILTPFTARTSQNLEKAGFGVLIYFMDRTDRFADRLLSDTFRNRKDLKVEDTEIEFDSDYKFIGKIVEGNNC